MPCNDRSPLQKLKKLRCLLIESLHDLSSLIDSFNISKSPKLAEVQTALIHLTGQATEAELSTSDEYRLAIKFLSREQEAVDAVAREIVQWYLETSFLLSDYLIGQSITKFFSTHYSTLAERS